MDASISGADLATALQSPNAPLLIDVRRGPSYVESRATLAGALRRDPERVREWASGLPRAAQLVVYCVHGHQVSQGVAQALIASGRKARYLEGGIAHWAEEGRVLQTKPAGAATRWVTRERPKIDRIACPWLIRRFIDTDAEFLYVPKEEVGAAAAMHEATAYDVPDAAFTHHGERCSFDAFLHAYRLADPALEELALIVRGADTGRPDLAPQSAGLLAVSLGLSRLHADDHVMLEHGMTVYDALYAWCRDGKGESHTWNPEALR